MTYTNVTATDTPNPDYIQTTVTFKGAAYPITAGTSCRLLSTFV